MTPIFDIKKNANTFDYSLTKEQIKMLEDRKQNHINNESKSYSWNNIKQELKVTNANILKL